MRKIRIFFIFIIIVFIFILFILPKLELGLYNSIIVKSNFLLNKTAFIVVKNYILENGRKCFISKIGPTNKRLYNAPDDVSFGIYFGPQECLFSTENNEIDEAIRKIHSTLTYNTIGYYSGSVVFYLSSYLKRRQGVLYSPSGEPVTFLSGLVTTSEIGNGWYYFDEARINDYPG